MTSPYFFRPEQLENIDVLGMSGKARSGKDYLAKEVAMHGHGFIPMSLADHFKVETLAMDRLRDDPQIDVREMWETDKSPEVRDALQQRGTEDGRDLYGDEIWVIHLEAMLYRFHVAAGLDRFVIPDIRFPNEVAWVKALGGKVYRVEGRGGLQDGNEGHRSEVLLDGFTDYDRVFDNSPEKQEEALAEMRAALLLDF